MCLFFPESLSWSPPSCDFSHPVQENYFSGNTIHLQSLFVISYSSLWNSDEKVVYFIFHLVLVFSES